MMIGALLLLLCLSSAGLGVVAQPVDKPESRFTTWHTLSSDDFEAALDLGYSKESWGLLFENPIELVSYEENSDDETIDGFVDNFVEAATKLDIDEEQWDCWISHYESYGWDEFEEDTRGYWEALGWNEDSWENGADPPLSEGKDWGDLNDMTEKPAAMELCFDADLWQLGDDDAETINEFGILGPGRRCGLFGLSIFCPFSAQEGFIEYLIRIIFDFLIFWN